ncbi:hypothetical protein Tco_0702928 [Tanacetum coccineum]|uniref:Uncharacterized protein n=1 Tax=Tanacetum coccineum TaxID=301880 RepID=A0ABQ4XYR2_9ASTR
MGEGSANLTDPHHTPIFIQPSPQPQKTQKPRKPKRKDTQVPQSSDPMENVVDEVVHKELGDSLVRAATTASSLEAEHESSNTTKTRSKATPNESSSQGTNSGDGPRCQETMGDTIAQTRRVKKLEKKDRSITHKLKRLYKLGLTARVESSDDEESLGEDASKQGRIDVIDADEEITLFSVHDVNVSAGKDEVVKVINTAKLIIDVAQVSAVGDKVNTASAATTVNVATTTTSITVDDITLAQDKGKGILIEPLKPLKKKDQIRLDEETALNLHADFDEEERLTREKAEKEQEANIALIETWDDIQAKIDVDHQLDERLQAQEQEKLLIKGKDEEEVAIDAIPLAVKSPGIVDWKVHKEERKSYYQIIRADGKSQMYMIFSHMLKSFDKEDLESLYKLVKAKYESTRPVEDLGLILWNDLKTMFEPHVEDNV